MADINEQKSTTLFHDRMEPLLEVYEDDFEAFGRLMHGLLSYSIYGEVITLDDKRENCDLKVLRNMVDRVENQAGSTKSIRPLKAICGMQPVKKICKDA